MYIHIAFSVIVPKLSNWEEVLRQTSKDSLSFEIGSLFLTGEAANAQAAAVMPGQTLSGPQARMPESTLARGRVKDMPTIDSMIGLFRQRDVESCVREWRSAMASLSWAVRLAWLSHWNSESNLHIHGHDSMISQLVAQYIVKGCDVISD